MRRLPAVRSLANRGRALEELLELLFSSAGPDVCMFRQANRVVLLRNGRAFPKEGAPLDFVGVISGVPVAVECKEVSGGRLSLGPSRFPEKEVDALRTFSEAGGRSYIVAAFWKYGVLGILSFKSFVELRSAGRKSLTSQDADFVLPARDAGQIVEIFRKRKGMFFDVLKH